MAEKQDILEEAIDIVEDQLEVVEKSASLVKRIIWNHKTHVGVAFAVGAGLGSAITYKVVQTKLTARYDESLTAEVEKIKDFYSRKEMTGEYADPVTAAKKLLGETDEVANLGYEALRNYQGGEGVVGDAPESSEEVEELVREEIRQSKKRNIFESGTEDFDWEVELDHRERISDADPYVITFEEYAEDNEFEEMTLTYLEGEKELCIIDETDKAIEDVDGTVGEDNLRFGYGSRDSNIVYVRNPRIGVNMEITRSRGTYASDVLGVVHDEDRELKHSMRRPRKFRDRDE